MDRIYIRDLVVKCVIGAFPAERRAKQKVVLNVVLACRPGRVARSDRLEDVVDYKAVRDDILAAVRPSRFKLIETLAEHVAAICLRHRGVRRVTVTVDKPAALRFARSVAVEITRSRRPG